VASPQKDDDQDDGGEGDSGCVAGSMTHRGLTTLSAALILFCSLMAATGRALRRL
jgi:hypothetical protein